MPDQTRNLNSVTDFAGTLDSNDRIIMTHNKASLKALTTAILGKAMIEGYTGSSLAGSSQSVKDAIDSLNSKLFKQLGANLSDEVFNALTADGLYVGYIPTTSCPCKQQWAYINVKSLSANANDVIQEVVGITSAITCTRMKSSGTWGNWVLAPTRAEVDALNRKKWKHLEMGDHATLTLSFVNNYATVLVYGTGSGISPFMAVITTSPNDSGIIQNPSNRGITVSGNKNSVVVTFPSSWYNMWVSAEHDFTYSIN